VRAPRPGNFHQESRNATGRHSPFRSPGFQVQLLDLCAVKCIMRLRAGVISRMCEANFCIRAVIEATRGCRRQKSSRVSDPGFFESPRLYILERARVSNNARSGERKILANAIHLRDYET
jgi:hypothetical protein